MKRLAYLLVISFAYAELMQCINDFTKITSKVISFGGSDPYDTMALYSGLKRNNLGDYSGCAELDYADYVVVGFSASPILVLTMCGSKNCTESDYRIIFNATLPHAEPPSKMLSGYSISEDTMLQFEKSVNIFREAFQELKENKSISMYQKLAEPLILKTYRQKLADIHDNSSTAEYPGFYNPIYYPQDYIQNNFNALSTGAIIMLIVCSILIGIAFTGTALDISEQVAIFKRKKEEQESINIPLTTSEEASYSKLPEKVVPAEPSTAVKVLMCFSLYTNIRKLFLSRSSEKTGTKETLDIFNGVRAMSMAWVVLGHVFLIKYTNSPLVNFQDAGDWYKHPKGAMIYGAEYAVDVFFWLSGFLVAYFFIMEYNAKNRMNWVYIYVHRFYRILPAYMFCLFLTWAFLKYIGNGPVWFIGDGLNNECKNYWWTNLIFLNNFIPDGDGSGCMGWSWYMANDMQFFLITPIILFLYHRIHKLIGWSLLMGLVLTNMLSSGLIASHKNYPVAPDQTFQKIYTKPYCRVGPYAIGVMFGLIYYTYKHHQKTGKIYDSLAFVVAKLFKFRPFRYLSYLLGLFLMNYLIFIQVEAYHDFYESIENGSPEPEDYWSQDERNIFYALSRIGFATGLSLVLVPILMGYNKLACGFLSHEVWTPLARLSYSGYLIHYGILWGVLLSRPSAGYLSDTEVFYDFIICLTLTYIAALPISLILESPFIGIERVLKGQAPKQIKEKGEQELK
jgi:peptidoglycan/LPS O-acetylase OafA/YrhL